ncbi:unnamed protein product [Phyllotreta striolata]|uniref:Kazal-like domain-containing protein n=1 Tax=Phyllotreta striolata TaxID=444603 RepID=A0A9N9TWJ5_PHYSR|nr:unnamed protein product [Phyllotreta striolata]
MRFTIYHLFIFAAFISRIQCYGLIKSLFKKINGKPSCSCSDIVQPVCGSDSHTYLNICSLECSHRRYHNVEKVSDGPCNDPFKNKHKKHKHREPHKGSMMDDYSEEESLMDHQHEFGREMACSCSGMLDPVCGTDGVTYLNECYVNCRRMELRGAGGLQAKARGFCRDYMGTNEENIFQYFDCSCMPYYEPVCGSDGRTYPNGCFLQCVNMYYPEIVLVDQNACLDKMEMIVQTGMGMNADYGVVNYNFMNFVPNNPLF